jgi:hypothetical protein
MFTLKEEHLRRLCQINAFPVPEDEMVFFGLRGCLPVDEERRDFRAKHKVHVVAVDYLHPRCVLGQWKPRKERIAVFPGSTVPHKKHVTKSREAGGLGANQLLTGFHPDYRKGKHKGAKSTGHYAFRQVSKLPIRRTADDLDFEEDDRIEYGMPFDNLHAAWCFGSNDQSYASAGCQVVAGFPKCEKRKDKPEVGAWRVFRQNAYDLAQDRFRYMLLNGTDAQRVVLVGSKKVPARLRFGSQGDLVDTVQRKLRALEHYEGDIDGDFGIRTLRAVMEFQEHEFGPLADDGVVGSMTAEAMRLTWPDL